MRRIITALLLGAGLLGSFATPTQAADGKKPRVLMVTQSAGFRHGSVTRRGDLSPAEIAMRDLASRTKLFEIDFTQDVANDFTREALDQADILFFYTTGKLPIAPDVLDYFLNDWLKQPGKGFVGTHSATDTYKNHAPYYKMINGTFNGHPWNAGSLVTITVHDKEHPASRVWGDEFEIRDEIYQFRNFDPKAVRVLMSLNMAKTQTKKPYHVPIAWVRDYGKGKCFYISLGHREDVWTNPVYQKSLEGGIRWILGLEPGDATPNPALSAEQDAKAKKDAS